MHARTHRPTSIGVFDPNMHPLLATRPNNFDLYLALFDRFLFEHLPPPDLLLDALRLNFDLTFGGTMDLHITAINLLLAATPPTRFFRAEKICIRHKKCILAHHLAALHLDFGRTLRIDPDRHLLPGGPGKRIARLVAQCDPRQSQRRATGRRHLDCRDLLIRLGVFPVI